MVLSFPQLAVGGAGGSMDWNTHFLPCSFPWRHGGIAAFLPRREQQHFQYKFSTYWKNLRESVTLWKAWHLCPPLPQLTDLPGCREGWGSHTQAISRQTIRPHEPVPATPQFSLFQLYSMTLGGRVSMVTPWFSAEERDKKCIFFFF